MDDEDDDDFQGPRLCELNRLLRPSASIQWTSRPACVCNNADSICSKCGTRPSPKPLTPTLIKGYQRLAPVRPAFARHSQNWRSLKSKQRLAGVWRDLMDVGLVALPRLPSSLTRQLPMFKVCKWNICKMNCVTSGKIWAVFMLPGPLVVHT